VAFLLGFDCGYHCLGCYHWIKVKLVTNPVERSGAILDEAPALYSIGMFWGFAGQVHSVVEYIGPEVSAGLGIVDAFDFAIVFHIGYSLSRYGLTAYA